MESILYNLESYVVLFWCQIGQRLFGHIFIPEKNTLHSPPPPPHFKELNCSSVSCLKYCIQIYLPTYTNAHFFFWGEISMRIICTLERFLFIWSNLHNETKLRSWTTPYSQFYETWSINLSRQNVCLTSCIASEFSRCITISHSTGILRVYNEGPLYFFRDTWLTILFFRDSWYKSILRLHEFEFSLFHEREILF